MPDDVRSQRKCYYASSDYAESFWGKFIYIYQGTGSLRLTTDSLCLEGCPQPIEIPFQAVHTISLDRFSSWAKPFGLSRLTIWYTGEDELRAIHLVPHESALDPTWVTSELVASWHETLARVEELTDRVLPPQFEPQTAPSPRKGFAVGALVLLLLPVAVVGLIGWLIGRF